MNLCFSFTKFYCGENKIIRFFAPLLNYILPFRQRCWVLSWSSVLCISPPTFRDPSASTRWCRHRAPCAWRSCPPCPPRRRLSGTCAANSNSTRASWPVCCDADALDDRCSSDQPRAARRRCIESPSTLDRSVPRLRAADCAGRPPEKRISICRTISRRNPPECTGCFLTPVFPIWWDCPRYSLRDHTSRPTSTGRFCFHPGSAFALPASGFESICDWRGMGWCWATPRRRDSSRSARDCTACPSTPAQSASVRHASP